MVTIAPEEAPAEVLQLGDGRGEEGVVAVVLEVLLHRAAHDGRDHRQRDHGQDADGGPSARRAR
jgi:hypothetical protein